MTGIQSGHERADAVLETLGTAAILRDPTRLPQATLSVFDPDNPELHAVTVTAGGRGSAWFVYLPSGESVLRKYRRGGMAARISDDRYVWLGAPRTRGFHEFRLLQTLRARGLPVPAPIAAAYWRNGSTYRAALLIERITGARSLGDALDAAQGDSANEIAWDAIGDCIARFHRAGAFHADLNVDNVLMDAQGQIWLIDFDRGAMRKLALGWQRANVVRLQRSLRKRVGVALGSEPLASGWKRLLAGYESAMWQPKNGAIDARDGST